MKKVTIAILILMVVICLLPMFSHAAPPDPDCDPLDPLCPIDGGVTWLIAAGIGLGARKAIRQTKKH